MPNVASHAVDRNRALERLDTFQTVAPGKLEQACRKVDNLGAAASMMRVLARLEAQLAADGDSLTAHLRAVAQAGAALFALARTPGSTIDIPIGGTAPLRLSGAIPPSTAHLVAWLNSCWAALAVRDLGSRAALSPVPTRMLRACTTRGDEFRYRMVDALSAFIRREDSADEHLHASLEATDPARTEVTTVDRVLNLHVPAIETLHHIFNGDERRAAEAPLKELVLHGKHWAGGGGQDDDEGFLALAPPYQFSGVDGALRATSGRHPRVRKSLANIPTGQEPKSLPHPTCRICN